MMKSNPSKSNRAWIFSVVLHVSLFTLATFLWTQNQNRGIVAMDSPRDIGIVIAQQHPANETEYFRPPQHATAAQQPTGATSAPATALPELQLPEIDLPGLNNLTAPILPGAIDDALSPSQLAGGVRATSPSNELVAAEQAKLPRSSGPTGPGVQVSLFGSAPAQGHRFVFVIDRSKSMGGQGLNAMSAAQQQLMQSLQSFDQQHHQFNIIAYHHRPTYFKKGNEMAESTPAILATVSPFFDGLASFGGTDHEMGLLAALRYKPDSIFLLTDGGDPGLNHAQISDLAKHCGARTSIHCIQFGFGPLQDETNFMMKIATATEGHFHYVNMREYNR
ncbi:MAG: VWA domain-containing protein [Planctomycetota bacterium]|nr:VWA domain-containing protein [Planctomycetota bacterium]